jgi:hypothetical protein
MHDGAPTGHGVSVTAQWTDTAGSVVFAHWGRAELEARKDALLIRLDAVDDDAAARMRTIIDNDLERFGRKQLAVEWHPAGPIPAEKGLA